MVMNGTLLKCWQLFDRTYQRIMKLEPVDPARENLFRVQVVPYHGPLLQTPDGALIQNGDLVCKIHLYNCLLMRKLQGITHQNRLGLLTLREIRRSLPGLADYIRTHPAEPYIKGVVGTTILYRGATQLGFTVAELPPSVFNWLKNRYLLWMLGICHPEGKRRLRRNPEKLTVRQLFMTKEQLYEKYGGLQEERDARKSVARHGDDCRAWPSPRGRSDPAGVTTGGTGGGDQIGHHHAVGQFRLGKNGAETVYEHVESGAQNVGMGLRERTGDQRSV